METGISKDPILKPDEPPRPNESIAVGVGCADVILGLFVSIFQARFLWRSHFIFSGSQADTFEAFAVLGLVPDGGGRADCRAAIPIGWNPAGLRDRPGRRVLGHGAVRTV
jgi:hypothetical protein